MNAAVFLDRDGTLVRDDGYVHAIEDLEILPHVAEGLTALKRAGFLLIVVTNQSGVARGLYGEADVVRFHAELNARLGPAAAIDAFYFCPFHPDAIVPEYRQTSPLRKPDIGMFHEACRDFAIAVDRSYMVGDRTSDAEFGRRAGLHSLLIGEHCQHLAEAADAIIRRDQSLDSTRGA
ncbi:MAG TPA: HAD family hydrolase [Polyangiales bacterium]|nr:HAD family hydrolase [Polyangiales bacterium]